MRLKNLSPRKFKQGEYNNLPCVTIQALKKISSINFDELSDTEYENLVSDISSSSNGEYFVIEEYGEWGRGIGIYILA